VKLLTFLKNNIRIKIYIADVEYNFQSLMKAANSAGAKVAVSVGGWSGGTKFR
jgi:GH18 family chitinase